MIGQPLRITTGGFHHIDVSVPGNCGAESDLRTIRREIRIYLETDR
jgi:hypothetical protein